MKIFFSFLLCAFIGLTLCFGQSKTEISLPVFKESVKIDSLMDLVLKNEKLSTNGCWTLEVFSVEKQANFQVLETTQRVINYDVYNWDKNKNKYGYFEYEGHKIFVVLYIKDFHLFFDETLILKTLPFIYKMDVQESIPPSEFQYPNVFQFKYREGHFIDNTPVAAKSIVK
jgi:hypothetical protein